MNCTACNAELKVGAHQCLECGNPVAVTAIPPDSMLGGRQRLFGDWVNLAVKIVKMEEPAMLEASRDPAATTMALIFIAISIAAPIVGSFGAFILLAPVQLVLTGIMYFAVHVCATLLGGKASFEQFIRVQGLTAMIGWVSAVPIIGPMFGWIIGLYGMVLMANNLRFVYKLTWPVAVAAMMLPGLLLLGAVCAMVMAFGFSMAALGVR